MDQNYGPDGEDRPFGEPPTAIWYGTAVGTGDDAEVAQLHTTIPDALFESVDNRLYIGFPRRFDALMTWVDTVGQYPGIKWAFASSGGGDQRIYFTEFEPIQRQPFTFGQQREYARWDVNSPLFSQWKKLGWPTLTTGADQTPRYWICLRREAGDVPNYSKLGHIRVRPYAYLATADDVEAQLQWRVDRFGSDGVPTINTVENFIRGAEDDLYRLTGHYFRPTFVDRELIDFRAYGMTIRYRPVLNFSLLEVWNGNRWESKVEGRVNGDYHLDRFNGLLYISTVFLDAVPPTLRRGYTERRTHGSFKRSVRVTYTHGHDASLDPFASHVRRIVTKQAALDVLTNHDFARLLPQQVDRIQRREKADIWHREIEEFKDRYAKLVMF